MNTQDIRKNIITIRKTVAPQQQHNSSQRVCEKITQQAKFKSAKKIAFYMAANSEISPQQLLETALTKNKQCYLPVLHPLKHNELWFVRFEKNDTLTPNQYGVLEPSNTKERIPAWALDVAFAPLVAFDTTCHRIGMGAGYYDRTFAFIKEEKEKPKPTLIGLAYEFQKIDNITPESWDIPMDFIVTEENDYKQKSP